VTRPKGTLLHFNPRPRHFLLLVAILCGMASLSGVDVDPDLRKIDPAILFRSAPDAISAPQSILSQKEPRVPVLIRLASDDDALPDQVRNLGGTARNIVPRIYAARLPTDATRYLSHRPAILYMEPDRVVWPLLDASRPAVSADIVQQGPPSLPQSFRGDNTYVGIVDTGLSGTHPDFDGRIAHTYSVSLALDPLVDTNGHGTHVTGIAAGDGAASAGTYTGMAPGARLLIGRAGAESFQTSAIIAAINDFLLFAGPTPVSINLSLGLFLGPHDGTSLFESTVNSLATGTAGSKQIIAVAAGNERNANEHFRTVLPPFGITTPTQVVEFASGTHSADIEIWADGEDEYSVTATMGSETITFLSGTEGTSPSGRIAISNKSSNPPNGATLIFLTFEPSPGTVTASIRLTRTRNGGTGTVDGYIDQSEGTFTAAVTAGTISEPANAENVLSIASFNTKTGGGAGSLGAISTFSSMGPTRDGRMKPDIAAPGSLIYSARSLEASFAPIEIAPNDNYVIMQGTSMATAHVTGIAPLVWESNPALTGAQMRERLKRTAVLQTAAPDTTWGHGKVNALSAITETVAGISGPARTLPGQNLTLRADEKSSGPYGNAVTYSWSAPGATVTPTGPMTTFTANTPGDYPVTLTAAPGSAPYNQASVTIRVNNVPTASISGPAVVDNVTSIPFSGTGRDADPQQQLSFHWILVARPAGSTSSLPTNNVDTVTLVPDRSGTYEVGLRVNDGLDDSPLETHTVAVALVTDSNDGGGGGGGCAIGIRDSNEDGASSVDALLLLLSPLGVLWARKRGQRFPRQYLLRSSPRR
jgi:subtilisin family serine protease